MLIKPKDVDVLRSKFNPYKVDTAGGDRPIRVIPGVGPGIAWNRQVYPVYKYEDNLVIFREDEYHKKSDCNVAQNFSEDQMPVWSPEPIQLEVCDWYIESQYYGHYVVFNGDKLRAISLSALLKAQDFKVIRYAKSFRPAENGIQYDWFIRVGKYEDINKLELSVVNFFENEKTNTEIPNLEISTLIEKIAVYLDDNGYLNRKVSTDDRMEETFYQAILNHFKDAESDVDMLDSQVEALKTQLITDKKVFSMKHEELVSKLSAYQAKIKEMQEGQSGTSFEEELLVELEKLEKENKRLTEAIANQQNTGATTDGKYITKNRSSSNDKDFMLAIAISFPKLAIDEDSMDCLLNDFNRRDGILSHLYRIQTRDHDPLTRLKGKSGEAGWMEYNYHIKDGQSSMGRIYLRESQITGVALEVVIHKKKDEKEQRRFIERLSDRPPLTWQAGYVR